MKIRDLASRIRLVYKRSSRTTKIAVCTAVVSSAVTLLVLHSVTLNAQAQAEAWRAEAQRLEQENAKLEEKIDSLGTLEGVLDIAQDELGMEDPDTVIIEPEN